RGSSRARFAAPRGRLLPTDRSRLGARRAPGRAAGSPPSWRSRSDRGPRCKDGGESSCACGSRCCRAGLPRARREAPARPPPAEHLAQLPAGHELKRVLRFAVLAAQCAPRDIRQDSLLYTWRREIDTRLQIVPYVGGGFDRLIETLSDRYSLEVVPR